jgi:hypothetical protein
MHTISMSGPGQRSTFQVREVALDIWFRRPTRRRTAVESTAAMACFTRAVARMREGEGDGDVLVRGDGVVEEHEAGPAVDEVDDVAVVEASQKARVGIRATWEDVVLAMIVDGGRSSRVASLTAFGSDRLPQYAGEQIGSVILVRVLTVTESLVSGYLTQSVPLAMTTCFQRKAHTASVELGACPDSVDWLCLSVRRLSSETK